jgi:hypothetical protein
VARAATRPSVGRGSTLLTQSRAASLAASFPASAHAPPVQTVHIPATHATTGDGHGAHARCPTQDSGAQPAVARAMSARTAAAPAALTAADGHATHSPGHVRGATLTAKQSDGERHVRS